MTPTTSGPISGDPDVRRPTIGDFYEYACPTCDRFRISGTAMLAEENDQEPLREALAVAKHLAGPGDVP